MLNYIEWKEQMLKQVRKVTKKSMYFSFLFINTKIHIVDVGAPEIAEDSDGYRNLNIIGV